MPRFGSNAFAVTAIVLWSTGALAQQRPDPAEASGRAGRELRCLEQSDEKLHDALELLRDTRAQARSQRAGRRARRDAARAIVAVEQRIARLTGRLSECIAEHAEHGAADRNPRDGVEVQRDEEGRPVVSVKPPRDPVAEAVAKRGSATDVLERDRRLTPHVHIEVGQLVDGHGEADESAVRDAISGIGGQLKQCYDALLDRSALERGSATLVFTVTPKGNVRDVHAEQVELGDASFERCFRGAARQLQVHGRARGGEAIYSYTLRFGPDE